MNTKVSKSMVSAPLLMFLMFFLTTPASADVVTNFISPGNNSGIQPIKFQLDTAPGVWIYTDSNLAAGPLIEMGAVIPSSSTLSIGHNYDSSAGLEEVGFSSVGDNSSLGTNNRVQSIVFWNNSDHIFPNDTLSVNFTYILAGGSNNSTSCTATAGDQAALVAAAIFTHSPLLAQIVPGYWWNPRTYSLQTASFCKLRKV